MSFATFFIGVVFFGSSVVMTLYRMMTVMFEQLEVGGTPMQVVIGMLNEGAPLMIAVIALSLFFSLISYACQVGFLFSPEAIKPDFKKMNPANYFKQLGNLKKTGFELSKNILMFVVFGAVLFNVYQNNVKKIQEMLMLNWLDSIMLFQEILTELAIKLGLVILVIGVVDYLFQKYQYEDNLKMKKQEVKDEHKNQNGNQEIRARQKQQFRQMLEKQVAKAVPDASVVIVNPTHYAVAIRYKKKKGDKVPKVIAKGTDHLALYMKEIARENDIPIVENIPLARKMHAEVEEGDYIPQELYEVVGKIIAKLVRQNRLDINK